MPPAAPFGDPRAERPTPLPELSFDETWLLGWRIFKGSYGVLLAAAVLMLVLQIGDSVVSQGLQKQSPALSWLWNLLVAVGASIPLGAAMPLVGARAARGRRAALADILLGYNRLGALILWTLLMYLVAAIILLPGALIVIGVGAFAGSPAALLVGIPVGLAYLGLFLCIGMRFQFVSSMLVDPELPLLGVVATARASWELTRGVWVQMVLITIVAMFMICGSILLLCVGLPLLGYPLMIAVLGAMYAMITAPLASGGALCPACGCELAGVPGPACPECGTRRPD